MEFFQSTNNYIDNNVMFFPQLSITDQTVTPADESPSVEESVCSTVHIESQTTEQEKPDDGDLINTGES